MICPNGIGQIEERCPTNPNQHYFSEIALCDFLEIPPQKPDKELITNVIKEFIITDLEELEVDLGDGVIRKKVVVTGVVRLGIEYSADEQEQHVHFAHFEVPFQGLIGYRPCCEVAEIVDVINEDVGTGTGTETVFQLDNANVVPFSETIYVGGVEQELGTDYTIDYTTGTVTFFEAPGTEEAPVEITADYSYYTDDDFNIVPNYGLIVSDFNLEDYNLNICVEHEQLHQLSPRTIQAFLVLLLWLEEKA